MRLLLSTLLLLGGFGGGCGKVGVEVTPNALAHYAVTNSGKLTVNGKPLVLRGVNWFGLENYDLQLHGLWTGRSIDSFLSQISDLGFNALRIPVVKETFDPQMKGPEGYATPEAQLEDLLTHAEKKGIYVVLDLHKCSKDDGPGNKPGPGIGDCAKTLPISVWHEQLRKLAHLSLRHKNVVGIDLFNEPWGYSWAQWKDAVEKAGREVLAVNPDVLVFVEGVGNESETGGFSVFWGENFVGAKTALPSLPHDRMVLSPHVYGPSVSDLEYFQTPEFPTNLPYIWDLHWGFLVKPAPLAGVVIGEFGGRYVDRDKVWGDKFVSYLVEHKVDSFFYWSLNPNSGDTGGLLEDDWVTVNQSKLQLVRRLMQ